MRMIDEDEVDLNEKPEDTRYINKRPVGLIAPPFKLFGHRKFTKNEIS